MTAQRGTEKLKENESINVVLKEYDGLRKEIDARTDATKTYGWPVVILAFGAILGWKPGLDINIALLFIPAVVMTIFALTANANHDMDKARKAIALIEDRVFILAAKPLLCHESFRVSQWRKDQWKWLTLRFIPAVVYVIIEWWLYTELPADSRSIVNSPSRKGLLVGTLSAPLLLYLVNTIFRYRLHRQLFFTSLLNEINNKKSPGNEQELLYDTNKDHWPRREATVNQTSSNRQ